MLSGCSFCGQDCVSFLTTCNECEKDQDKEDFDLSEELIKLRRQNKLMARWIFDTVELELDSQECQDDCAYQESVEILGKK